MDHPKNPRGDLGRIGHAARCDRRGRPGRHGRGVTAGPPAVSAARRRALTHGFEVDYRPTGSASSTPAHRTARPSSRRCSRRPPRQGDHLLEDLVRTGLTAASTWGRYLAFSQEVDRTFGLLVPYGAPQ